MTYYYTEFQLFIIFLGSNATYPMDSHFWRVTTK